MTFSMINVCLIQLLSTYSLSDELSEELSSSSLLSDSEVAFLFAAYLRAARAGLRAAGGLL